MLNPSLGRRVLRPVRLSIVVVIILLIGVLLTILNIYQLQQMRLEHSNHKVELLSVVEGETGQETGSNSRAPVVWLEGKNQQTGYLKHVEAVFMRLGFTVIKEIRGENWDILWTHTYPFRIMADTMKQLKPYQRVNHLPGSGFVTNKGSLIHIENEVIPVAFKIPSEKDGLLQHTKDFPDKLWVQKNNNHRGIRIVPVQNEPSMYEDGFEILNLCCNYFDRELNFTLQNTFVQEYVGKPFLVDGRKFDMGIYTIITSIDPLRMYIISDEILIRFGSKDYYPFDSADTAKYVINDNYTPIWKMSSLKGLYTKKMFSAKETINHFMASQGKNMSQVWRKIEESIPQIYLAKMSSFLQAVQKYKSPRNFFEMVRFDFVLDKDLKVYLMEVNLSPNLSTGHFAENRLLYEHVIYNALRVAGVASMVENQFHNRERNLKEMLVSDRDIAVFPEWCGSDLCTNGCDNAQCILCSSCLTSTSRQTIRDAYLEHVNRGSCRRVFPPSLNQTEALSWSLKKDIYTLTQYDDKIIVSTYMANIVPKEVFGHIQKVKILTTNHVIDTVGDNSF